MEKKHILRRGVSPSETVSRKPHSRGLCLQVGGRASFAVDEVHIKSNVTGYSNRTHIIDDARATATVSVSAVYEFSPRHGHSALARTRNLPLLGGVIP